MAGTMPGIVTKTERSWSDPQKAKDHLIINIGRTGLRSINKDIKRKGGLGHLSYFNIALGTERIKNSHGE